MRTKSKQVDHFAVAAPCRANPGQWQEVGEYNSTLTAAGIVRNVRAAYAKGRDRRSAWNPAGAFDARRELTEFGARVEARFVGAADDAAWADAVAALTGGAAA